MSTAHGEPLSESAIDVRTRALKERIYATFTGLAILAAITATGHSTAWEAFVAVAVGILGISAAGFLAEVVSHQVNHQQSPDRSETGVMARIALGPWGRHPLHCCYSPPQGWESLMPSWPCGLEWVFMHSHWYSSSWWRRIAVGFVRSNG
ncbi:hypothetical protein [Cryobacterium sp. AP23]